LIDYVFFSFLGINQSMGHDAPLTSFSLIQHPTYVRSEKDPPGGGKRSPNLILNDQITTTGQNFKKSKIHDCFLKQ